MTYSFVPGTCTRVVVFEKGITGVLVYLYKYLKRWEVLVRYSTTGSTSTCTASTYKSTLYLYSCINIFSFRSSARTLRPVRSSTYWTSYGIRRLKKDWLLKPCRLIEDTLWESLFWCKTYCMKGKNNFYWTNQNMWNRNENIDIS